MADYIAIDQNQRLLDEKDSCEIYDVTDSPKLRRTGLRRFLASPPSWATCIFVCYAVLSLPLLTWMSLHSFRSSYQPYSPVNDVVDHETQKIVADRVTIFGEQPSKDHDMAWEDLLAPMHMSATKHELEKSNDYPDDRLVLVKTVPEGIGQGRWTNGDYLATLGVYHELHCLRRIFWHFYPDIYFVNMTSELMELERGHARHCIDTIRQSLMCTPNLGLYTFKWKGDNEKPELKTGAERTCVKWHLVQGWANFRATGWNPLVWKPGNKTSV